MEDRKRTSSGSEGDDRYSTMDEKKRKRMISNRESARRSRMRREQHLKDLRSQIAFFESKRNEMIQRMNQISQSYAVIETENRVLMAQKEELSKRLECAEIISSYINGGTSSEYNLMEFVGEDPWMKAWQAPPQFLPMITTSAGVFNF